jgi:hypothetical protein
LGGNFPCRLSTEFYGGSLSPQLQSYSLQTNNETNSSNSKMSHERPIKATNRYKNHRRKEMIVCHYIVGVDLITTELHETIYNGE